GRPPQIEGASGQLGSRAADREADAHARYGERIAPAVQDQHALAGADSDDESAPREDDGNLTGFGPRRRAPSSHASEQGNESYFHAELFHDPLLKHGRAQCRTTMQDQWRVANQIFESNACPDTAAAIAAETQSRARRARRSRRGSRRA